MKEHFSHLKNTNHDFLVGKIRFLQILSNRFPLCFRYEVVACISLIVSTRSHKILNLFLIGPNNAEKRFLYCFRSILNKYASHLVQRFLKKKFHFKSIVFFLPKYLQPHTVHTTSNENRLESYSTPSQYIPFSSFTWIILKNCSKTFKRSRPFLDSWKLRSRLLIIQCQPYVSFC